MKDFCTTLLNMQWQGYSLYFCAMADFEEWLFLNKKRFPVPEDKFHLEFAKFWNSHFNFRGKSIGFIDGKLVYYKATILHYDYLMQDRERQIEIEKEIDDVMDRFNKFAPKGLQNGWHIAFDHWAWQNLRSTVISSSVQGILLSLLFALIVMILTTGNVWVSVLAIFSISSVKFCLMGVIKINGGNFGIIESTCMIVFIGLSVDYIAHVSHQYTESRDSTRLERTNFALGQMG